MPSLDEQIEPSSDLAARFHARLENHRLRAAPLAAPPRPGGWWKRFLALGVPRQLAAAGALAAVLVLGVYLSMHRVDDPLPPSMTSEIPIAENLPLLQDMAVIQNLDLLEDFDAIRNLSAGSATAQ